MPRISTLSLDQVNRQLDTVDTLRNLVSQLQSDVSFLKHHVNVADPIHAPSTTNNLTFTWTGGTQTLSWLQGFIKDKNWSAQSIPAPNIKSSAPGQQHSFTVPAGSLSLAPSTYYWLAWDVTHQIMRATPNVDTLHNNFDVHVICQIYTGTAGQTGSAGGGGSTGGVDLSGARYKNF